jgi:hypothetical protein
MKFHLTMPALAGLALSSLSLLGSPLASSAWAAPACGTENLIAGKRPLQQTDIKGDTSLVTDGKVGADGTMWDAPVAVTFETAQSALVYDLGEPREVGAFFVQADANDTYKIAGALENNPAAFKPLVQLANVVDRGHGLRTRNLEITPTTVRYIRFGEAAGDGYFSISEMAVYCKTPSPWPPAMKVVDAPPAATPADVHAPPKPSTSSDGGRSAIFLGVAALFLAWLAYRTIKRGSEGPATAAADAPSADEPEATAGTDASASTAKDEPPKDGPPKDEPPKSA